MQYSEEEKQQQRNDVVEMIDNLLEQYDWDTKVREYIEKLQLGLRLT